MLSILINKNTNKTILITPHNFTRCQMLWMANNKKHTRKFINNEIDAQKYGCLKKYYLNRIEGYSWSFEKNRRDIDKIKKINIKLELEKKKINLNFRWLFNDEILKNKKEIKQIKLESKKYECALSELKNKIKTL